jgi:hypothetical protein
MVELQSKTMVTAQEHEEIESLKRLFRRYVYNGGTESARPNKFGIVTNSRMRRMSCQINGIGLALVRS